MSSELFRPISRSPKDPTPTPESITLFALDPRTHPAAHAPDRARVIGAARGRPRAADPARISLPLSSFSLSPPFLFLSPIFLFPFLLFFSSLFTSSSVARPDRATPPRSRPALLRLAWPPSSLSLASCSARSRAAPLSYPRALLGSSPPRALPTPPARSHRAGTHAPRRGTGTLHASPCHARACSTRPSHPPTAAVDAAQRRLPEASRYQCSPRPLPPLTPHSAACPRRRVASARR